MNDSKMKNQGGMSLVEMLVVVGILSFISLVVATTFSDIFKMQTQVLARDEANEFTASVGRFIFSESACSSALLSQVLPAAPNTKGALILPGYLGYGAGSSPMTLATNTSVSTRLRIRELSIQNKGMPGQDVLANGVTLQRHLAQINLVMETFEPESGEWKGGKTRTFELPVLVAPASRAIQRCYTEMKIDDACQVLGTTFDATQGRCIPQTQCLFEGHFSVNNCNSPQHCPTGATNDLTGGHSCPNGGTTQKETGVYEWEFVRRCGKKCSQTINVTTHYYVCLKCN